MSSIGAVYKKAGCAVPDQTCHSLLLRTVHLKMRRYTIHTVESHATYCTKNFILSDLWFMIPEKVCFETKFRTKYRRTSASPSVPIAANVEVRFTAMFGWQVNDKTMNV
jgi:hypothetical protein